MIAYLDTCTILNLLQVNFDDEYLRYTEKAFEKVKLTPIVFKELNDNKYVNVIDASSKETLNNLLYTRVQNYVDYTDYDPVLDFSRKHNEECFKTNGESHSISYAIHESRFGNKDFGEILLKVHFITDDRPAKADFDYFYQINLSGHILNSIDLMTLFWLKKYISKNRVIEYCLSLKKLYNKDVNLLSIKVQEYSSKFSGDITSRQKILLTTLIDLLNDFHDDLSDKLREFLRNPDLRDVFSKNGEWDTIVSRIVKSNFREKIPYIDQRIKDLFKVWEIL